MKQKFLTSTNFAEFEIFGDNMKIMNFTDIVDISPILKKYENKVLTYITKDDEKIEGISYYLYQSPDFYDLLMIMNGMTNPEQLPRNSDIVFKKIEEEYLEWLSVVGAKKSEQQKKDKKLWFDEQIKLENEKYRTILYFPKQLLSLIEVDFKNLLKNLKKTR